MKRFTLTATIDLPDGLFAEARTIAVIEEWIQSSVNLNCPEGMVISHDVSTIRRARAPKAPGGSSAA